MSFSLGSLDEDMKMPFSFFLCIEPDDKGILIENSIILIESIRMFGGRFSTCPVYTISPRGKQIPYEIKRRLSELNTIHVEMCINSKYCNYPHANKIYAGSYLEKVSKTKTIVFLDSDSVILNEPAEFDLPKDVDVGLTPVWLKGIGCSGDNDISTNVWELAYSTLNKKIPTNHVLTRINKEQILPYYNSGMIVTRRSIGFFNLWQLAFENIMSSDLILKLLGIAYNPGDIPYQPLMFVDQLSLSVAISSSNLTLSEFPVVYNCPLHHKSKLSKNYPDVDFNLGTVVHWHHNNYLSSPEILDMISNGVNSQEEKRKWIESRSSNRPYLSSADNEQFLELFDKSMASWRNFLYSTLRRG